jgi:rod shape-determining protein MreB
VPSEITAVERHAVLTTAARAGARQVCLIDKAKAAGLGAGLPLAEPVGSMICDLGGGTTEIAVLCMGDVAVSESLRVAGEEIDRAIMDYLRRKHMMRIGEQMAERIKVEIGTAVPGEQERSLTVRGCDVVSGLPRQSVVTSEEVREAVGPPLEAIVAAIGRTLGRCHPELSADLMENGMVLAGGGAQLGGLDRRLAHATGMPVRVTAEPLTCVVRGLGICLEHLDTWHTLIERRQAA